jgi:hypothetical protein
MQLRFDPNGHSSLPSGHAFLVSVSVLACKVQRNLDYAEPCDRLFR